KSRIRRNIKLAESPSFGKTILSYDPASNGAADYRSLAKEILSMEGAAVAPADAAALTPSPGTPGEGRGEGQLPIPPVPAASPKPSIQPPLNPEPRTLNPKKPKLAVLVTPEEAARLKAAKLPELADKPV